MSTAFSASTSITINASAQQVWDGLTRPELIKQYLHGTDTKTTWQIGEPIIWKGTWKGKSYEDKGTVLDVEPLKLLSTTHWSPMSGTEDKPENYHIVTYELSPADGQTTLTLTQSNSPTQQDVDSMIENGWKPILQTLKTILEKKM